MGNCASDPKTNEGSAPAPEKEQLMSNEEKKVEEIGKAKEEETPIVSDDKSLGTLLNENEKEDKVEVVEEPKKEAEEAEKPKTEEVKAEEEPKKEEAEKTETKEEKPETETA